MKIACIGYLHGFGGAERQLITLANQMVERGHDVHMILVSDNKICYPLNSLVKIHSLLEAESGNKITRILRRRKALINELKDLNCNIVVNFNFQSVYMLAFENKKRIGKVVYSERGDPGDKEYTGLMGLVRRIVIPKIDGFVFQSEGARDFFSNRHVKQNCCVIPNACFKSYQPYTGLRRKAVVTVGRLSAQKNQALLIRAFARIADKYPDFSLEIYGSGELEKQLMELIDSLGLHDRVFLKGTSDKIQEIIRDARLFVLSSDYEGIPNALIEAMSLGLPCVSTDCKPGGAKTLIENGYNGLVTSWRDEYSLSKAIDFMISAPKDAQLMGNNAMNISKKLSPNSIYDKWETCLYGFSK